MRVAVLRALQLGDLLVAVPALRALRRAYPEAHLTLVALPWTAALLARFPRYIDALEEYPGRRADYDLVLQMHGDGSCTNAIALALGGKRMAGFWRPGNERPEIAVEWDDRENEVLRCLRLVERVCGVRGSPELEFPLGEADWAEWRAFGLAGYACVHAGSQLASRRWPPARFAAVADALAARGLKIVLTGGKGELALVDEVAQHMRSTPLNLAGRTTLGGLAALVARARLVLCNDTSVSHIAAALRTPSVVVCCGADPQRWAPLNGGLHHVIAHPIACRPCLYTECPIGHPCALNVSSGAVMEQVERKLACAA